MANTALLIVLHLSSSPVLSGCQHNWLCATHKLCHRYSGDFVLGYGTHVWDTELACLEICSRVKQYRLHVKRGRCGTGGNSKLVLADVGSSNSTSMQQLLHFRLSRSWRKCSCSYQKLWFLVSSHLPMDQSRITSLDITQENNGKL